MGKPQDVCYNCSYCRAIDTCGQQTEFDILPTQISQKFSNLPVAINLLYGDPLLQIDNTLKYLKRLEQEHHKGIVTIITKGDYSKFPDIPFDLDLHIAFSTFGITNKYDGGSWKQFIKNLEQINKRKNNYVYSIEFRPICYQINDNYSILEKVIQTASQYGLSVGYSGLQGKPEVVEYWKENGIDLKPYPNFSFGHIKSISAEVEQNIRGLAEKYNVNLFHKTSCMLSYTHNLDRDYNCHYYRPDEVRCDLCPMRDKCKNAKNEVREIKLPFEFSLNKKKNHECILYKTGKCNYPTENCRNISGYIIDCDEHLTIADYRVIKWLTGYMVNNDFTYDNKLSDFWKYY